MKAKIITDSNCNFCIDAKILLFQHGISYYEVPLGDAIDIMIEHQVQTVPQIWLDGVHIGGYTELKEHLEKDSY